MPEKQPKFEDALKELEGIIEELEGGELPLDDSLERYERGVKALNACRKILGEAEKKIQLLLRTTEGELKTEPFEPEETAAEAEDEKNENDNLPF
ncbi:MAG: exodeoxyribonuclease VII small subunit [Planctomycetes bacterium]|jgi:exodeoxyribonuclease VII small subunit|nr:exodeoxyribonuclease VII small subunit [Planctomycetota bacterium]